MTEAIITGVSNIVTVITGISDTMKNQVKTNAEITQGIRGALKLADRTRISTEEQKIAAVEITKSVSNMNEMTQNKAAGAEELSGSSTSVSVLANELKSEVNFFHT